MQHTADACDPHNSEIRNYLYKNRPNTIRFPDKVRNNTDFLLFAFCNIGISHWFVFEKQIFVILWLLV
jgi:hypothetical protein